MLRNRIVACLTLLVLALALTGIFCYASYLKKQETEKRGVLVQAFSQKANECWL